MQETQKIKINQDSTITATLSDGKTYTLREPLGKDMEGLSQDLIKVKHNETVQKLLNRIATPQITRVEFAKMPFSDLNVLGAALDFFIAPPNAKADMKAALTDLGYLSESVFEPTNSPE